jgi:hypothetical protein
MDRRIRWLLIGVVVLAGCGKGDSAGASKSEIAAGQAELRKLEDSGAAPLNACRARLQQDLRRTGRGAPVEQLAASKPVLCLSDGVFFDCADVAKDRFKDVCGSLDFLGLKSPTSAPGDGKRFLTDLAAFKANYQALVARASTAKPALLYRERCRWGDDKGLSYENRTTGEVKTFSSTSCDVELTSLDDALAPVSTVTASATVQPQYKAELEKEASEIERANKAAHDEALQQSRTALFAKIKP